jgi:hypothetical protein
MDYCRVLDRFLPLGPSDTATLTSHDALSRYLSNSTRTLLHQVSNLRSRYPDHALNNLDSRYVAIGYSVLLQNASGELLQLGVSESYWLLILQQPTRLVRGKLRGEELVVYYLPEWTEFELRELLPSDEANALVREWLGSGTHAGG